MTPRLTPKKIELLLAKSEKLGEKLEALIVEIRTLSSGDYRAADEAKVKRLRSARSSMIEALGMLGEAEDHMELAR